MAGTDGKLTKGDRECLPFLLNKKEHCSLMKEDVYILLELRSLIRDYFAEAPDSGDAAGCEAESLPAQEVVITKL